MGVDGGAVSQLEPHVSPLLLVVELAWWEGWVGQERIGGGVVMEISGRWSW